MKCINTAENYYDFYPSRTGTPAKTIERKDPVVYQFDKIGKYSLDEEQLRKFKTDGYIILRNYFPEHIIKILRNEFTSLCQNKTLHSRDEVVLEPDSNEVRSLFHLDNLSPIFKKISHCHQLLDIVMQILGGAVYLHQSRINIKPAYRGKSFSWHSDFETWHVEDGIPRMRTLSCSIFLTENNAFNGPLFVIPGSHHHYLPCPGNTPEKHYHQSLRKQIIGSPDIPQIDTILEETRIKGCFGSPGDMLIFDSNVLHGSPDNISNEPRTNLFLAYNSCENIPENPYCGLDRRPIFLANTNTEPLNPLSLYNS